MISPESVRTTESLVQRIEKYIPSPEVLRDYPRPGVLEQSESENQEHDIPGSNMALVTSRYDGGLVIVPYDHPENAIPPQSPGTHYSHVAFEGISLVPEVDSSGRIRGANLILFRDRMERFRNSIRALGGGIPEELFMTAFERGIVDLASVLGERVLRDKNGNPSRAYVRPAYVRLGPYGVAPKEEAPYHLSAITWNWSLYKIKEVYEQGAIAVAFLDAQRNEPVYGKLAGNYVHGGILTQTVEQYLKGNEVLYLGPYIINGFGKKVYLNNQAGGEARDKLLHYGMPVDGSGEDILFEGRDGTVYYLPKDTNILGGTTREYIIRHMARRLGINVEERWVSFDQMRKGEIVGLSYVGNAVKALQAREIQIYDSWRPEGALVDTIELKFPTPNLARIQQALEDELFHRIPPSHPGLLTPIDLSGGRDARRVLEKVYSGWF